VSRPLKICFVAHFAYRAISGASGGHIGGVERQTNLMAKWLAARGHKVSVLVWDEGQGREVEFDGVRVISICRQDAGLPGLRFFAPRWSGLISAMKRADADIYYHNCAEYVTGQVALWAARHGRRFIYSVASDPGCHSDLPTLKTIRERVLYRTGLRKADAVIAQSQIQKGLLKTNFHIDASVLPMPCETLPEAEGEPDESDRPRILWIGRLAPVKQAELAIALAKECPTYDFDIVGPDGTDEGYVQGLRDQSAGLENVHWIGPVDFTRVRAFYERSTTLLCTSAFEGFPNTFLEAWSCGCPVVSTVDPDNVIADNNLGRFVGPDSDLATQLRQLVENDEQRSTAASNCRDFFASLHEKEIAMQRFERLFKDVR
jgi:glycosyltransferase involved in cell wall biosynthesis